jgi:mannose-1-phosphate guanylyltransferase/mannose-6-phosphate isomerase
MKIVIMAGGEGQRLWPLSTQQYPKQFLEIASSQSMLVQTIERFKEIVGLKNIWIVTGKGFKDKIEEICVGHFKQKLPIIVEPASKNTGFAITYALKFLKERGCISKDEPVLFSPSDQKMECSSDFFHHIQSVEKLDKMRLFAIKPVHPHTGFGYIELASSLLNQVEPVLCFHEKPTLEKAKEYLESGRYFWNSGIVILTAALLEKELKKYQPDYHHSIQTNTLPELSISFDHLLLEKSKEVEAVVLDVKWIDIGSFGAIFSLVKEDERGNAAIGDTVYHESTKNWVMGSGRSVALLGMHNTAVIDTPVGLVISSKTHLDQLSLIKHKFCKTFAKIVPIKTCESCRIYEFFLKPGQEGNIDFNGVYQVQVLRGACEIIFNQKVSLLQKKEANSFKNSILVKNIQEEELHLLLMEWL